MFLENTFNLNRESNPEALAFQEYIIQIKVKIVYNLSLQMARDNPNSGRMAVKLLPNHRDRTAIGKFKRDFKLSLKPVCMLLKSDGYIHDHGV